MGGIIGMNMRVVEFVEMLRLTGVEELIGMGG